MDLCRPPNCEVLGTTGFEVSGRREFGDFQYGIARRAFRNHLVTFPHGTCGQAEAQREKDAYSKSHREQEQSWAWRPRMKSFSSYTAFLLFKLINPPATTETSNPLSGLI